MTFLTPPAVACACVALTALLSSSPRPLGQAAPASSPRTIELKATDDMKFDRTTLQARRGETLRLRLVAIGRLPKIAMSHNFVLLKKNADAKAFADKAATARASGFVPQELKGQVVAASGLVGPGETTEVTFTAPSEPGRYEFICTFPGHFVVGMKGILIVA